MKLKRGWSGSSLNTKYGDEEVFFGICWKRSNDRSGHCGRLNDLKALLKTSGKINTLDVPFEMKKIGNPTIDNSDN